MIDAPSLNDIILIYLGTYYKNVVVGPKTYISSLALKIDDPLRFYYYYCQLKFKLVFIDLNH